MSQADPMHVDPTYGKTFMEYVKLKTGIDGVIDAHVVMVSSKRTQLTTHI